MSFVLALSIGGVANAAIQDGLLVFHDFGNLADDSGNGHDAELFGTAQLLNGYLVLDGSGAHAIVGEGTFGAVNPVEDNLSDFTIAVVYNTLQTDAQMLVGMGPVAGNPGGPGDGSGDLSLFGNSEFGTQGHGVDHWWVGYVGSTDSGINYADGSDHLLVVTYTTADNTYTWYHLEAGSAVAHGTGTIDWADVWDAALDYDIGLGTSPNPNADLDFGPQGDADWAYFNGGIDKFAVWDRALDTSEMPDILDMTGGRGPSNPRPTDGNPRVDPNDLILIWTKDPCAVAFTEDVFFSHIFDDVNERNAAARKSTNQDPNYWPTSGDLNDDVNLGEVYYWAVDEVLNEDPYDANGPVWSFTVKTAAADLPDPENGEDGISPCPTLTWDPGAWAVKHNVYWSDVFAEVNDRTIDPCVLNEPTAESLSIGPLAYETVFYWAVDEANAADVCTPGPLWSFMTGPDPCTAPLQRNTNNSLYAMWGFDSDWGSGKTVADPCWVIPADPNFDANSVDDPCDWLANYTPPGGGSRSGIADNNGPAGTDGENSIRLKHTDYAIPGQTVTILAEIISYPGVPDSVELQRVIGFGPGIVPIGGWDDFEGIQDSCEPDPVYSFQLCDGWTYSLYEVEYELVGAADNIHVDIDTEGDFYIDYVEVDAWWRTPLVAHDPNPGIGDVNVPLGKGKLTWRPGLYADKHDVYFGTDEDAVTDACSSVFVSDNQDPNYYPPTAGSVSLNPGTTYYWRVDEVNDACDPCLWPGQVWSFTTIPYIVIEDFETYATASELYAVWEDWHSLPEQGGESILEGGAALVHGDLQALKFVYNHSYGEPVIRRTYSTPQDWSAGGLAALWMWVYGDANNAGTLATGMYIELGDDDNDKAKIYYSDPRTYSTSPYHDVNDLWRKTYYEWGVALEDFNDDNNVNPHKIKTISFGVNGGNSGQIYYDDLRLYVPRCLSDYAVQFGNLVDPEEGLDCLVDRSDLGAFSDDWLIPDVYVQSVAVADDDPNLLVHYVFDDVNGLNDVSGNDYHGFAINDVNVHDGILTLINRPPEDGSPPADVNAVEIGGTFMADTGNPFRGATKGGGDFTIAMDFAMTEVGILFSSCPYDPCVTEPPNSFDPSQHAMGLFAIQFGEDDPIINYDNWYISASTPPGNPLDGEWHSLVVTHDADGGISEGDFGETEGAVTGLTRTYMDGFPSAEDGLWDPNLSDPCNHKVRIGDTMLPSFPYADGAGDLTGDVDNVRIFDRVLTHGEVVWLMGVPAGNWHHGPVPSDAELYDKEAQGQQAVNFRDEAILYKSIGPGCFLAC
jgi:hypothetical protein